MTFWNFFKLLIMRFIVIKCFFLIIVFIPFNVNAKKFSATEYVHTHAKYQTLIELISTDCGINENDEAQVINVLLNKKDTLPDGLLDIWEGKFEETLDNFQEENFT